MAVCTDKYYIEKDGCKYLFLKTTFAATYVVSDKLYAHISSIDGMPNVCGYNRDAKSSMDV